MTNKKIYIGKNKFYTLKVGDALVAITTDKNTIPSSYITLNAKYIVKELLESHFAIEEDRGFRITLSYNRLNVDRDDYTFDVQSIQRIKKIKSLDL